MFGRMNAVPILDLRHAPAEAGASLETAVAKLLDVTDHPAIAKWVQLPKALFVFLVVPGDPESGAFYVFDRRKGIWFWVDFEDEKFSGYTVAEFDTLRCRLRSACILRRSRVYRHTFRSRRARASLAPQECTRRRWSSKQTRPHTWKLFGCPSRSTSVPCVRAYRANGLGSVIRHRESRLRGKEPFGNFTGNLRELGRRASAQRCPPDSFRKGAGQTEETI